MIIIPEISLKDGHLQTLLGQCVPSLQSVAMQAKDYYLFFCRLLRMPRHGYEQQCILAGDTAQHEYSTNDHLQTWTSMHLILSQCCGHQIEGILVYIALR